MVEKQIDPTSNMIIAHYRKIKASIALTIWTAKMAWCILHHGKYRKRTGNREMCECDPTHWIRYEVYCERCEGYDFEFVMVNY